MQTSLINTAGTQQQTEGTRSLTHVPESRPEIVKITMTGSPEAVKATIYRLHRLSFVEATAWTPPQKTGKLGQVISLLSYRLWLRP